MCNHTTLQLLMEVEILKLPQVGHKSVRHICCDWKHEFPEFTPKFELHKVKRRIVLNGKLPLSASKALQHTFGMRYRRKKKKSQHRVELNAEEKTDVNTGELNDRIKTWCLKRRANGTRIHCAFGFWFKPGKRTLTKKTAVLYDMFMPHFEAIGMYLHSTADVCVASENKVYSGDLGVTGRIDFMCFNQNTQKYVVHEIKTKNNQGLRQWEEYEHGAKGAEACRKPFSDVQRSDRAYATMQLHLYAKMLSETLGINVGIGMIFVIDAGCNEVAAVKPLEMNIVRDKWFSILAENWNEID